MTGGPREADVAIVGARLTGLVAARDLIAGGSSVVVREARELLELGAVRYGEQVARAVLAP